MKSKLTVVLLVLQLSTSAQAIQRYQVVIDEIMADPSPVVGLPPVEYIELRNTSNQTVNLQGCRIGDGAGTALITNSYLLLPDSVVVLCSNSNTAVLSLFGHVIGISNFPSLDNDGELLYLLSPNGTSIHAVVYNSSWYANTVKALGGWSLEMIDVKNACAGAGNWMASKAANGGTPGQVNSVNAVNKDPQPPALLSVFVKDDTHVELQFDEPLDSLSAANAGNYNISSIGKAIAATPVSPLFITVIIETAAPVSPNQLYDITVTAVSDCAGNSIGAYHSARLGRAVNAGANDIVINEILFNPWAGGTDYLELYNRSNHVIDLGEFYTATRNTTGAVSKAQQISSSHRLLFPGDYVLVTDDIDAVSRQYLTKDRAALLQTSAMPSMPDDKGDVLLLNAQGVLIDEVAYDAHWHFKLLNNDEGVALERIDYNQPSQLAMNWHSAATSAGYGTPGYINSQFHTDGVPQAALSLTASIFSPDNDGLDDFVSIQYQFPTQGYTCNITIYDANGRPVRLLTRNAICSQQGYFRWDGLGDNAQPLPMGVYIVLSEVFTLQGNTKKFKQALTLARRF